jgi:tripartite ATP-independent transporter DctM subunit
MRGGLVHRKRRRGRDLLRHIGAAVADCGGARIDLDEGMPRLGYAPPFAGAVVMAVSTLGPIIPPSIMMVVYAITADVSIARLFVAGHPARLVHRCGHIGDGRGADRLQVHAAPEPTKFSRAKLLKTAWSAVLALLAPVVILRGMASGLGDADRGGRACLRLRVAGRDAGSHHHDQGIVGSLVETAEASALILFIIAASSALSYVFVAEGTAAQLSQLMASLSIGTVSFLIISNLLLFILGCFVETAAAMLIAVPLLVPTAKALGVDLVHFGVVVIFNLLIGFMHPPIGIGLFIMMSISNLKFGELAWAAVPFVLALCSRWRC